MESDPDTLIDIALSYIPTDSAVANAIAVARAAHQEGVDWKEARRRILCAAPGTFGLRYSPQEEGIPDGKLGFDAPSNIGLMVMAWLFGENDFSKSVCIAAGCGEDADCTAGTLAATFGIINGTKSIDKKWTDPIGDTIKTVAISRASLAVKVPETVSELTQRVSRLMPVFLKDHVVVSENGMLEIEPSKDMKKQLWNSGWIEKTDPYWYMFQRDLMAKKKNSLFEAYVMMDSPEISENTDKEIRIRFINRAGRHLWTHIHVQLPEEWGETHTYTHACRLNEFASGSDITDKTIRIPVGTLRDSQYTVDVTVAAAGYPSKLHIPLTLIKAD